ncbi:MAG: hypothetical protein DWQ06_11710 [Calditrichaeota bacterium]|nr:MAG: hypothetical protein DWQ06_11710 [Calditrichota bacterium]
MKKFLFIFLLSFGNFVYAGIVERPTFGEHVENGESLDLLFYSWIHTSKDVAIIGVTNKIASEFMSEEDITRYFKLKMRNFLKDYKFHKKTSQNENSIQIQSIISIELNLWEYSSKLEIIYGLLSFKMRSTQIEPCNKPIYEITVPITGSKGQIKSFVKDSLGSFVEWLAEDYYYIEDLKKKSNK